MTETKTKKGDSSILRIIVSAFEAKMLDKSIKEILSQTDRLEAVVKGPVPLPTKQKKWTVNRASFIYEASKEQYEMKVHRRLIDIVNPSDKVIQALSSLALPTGVNVDVKMV